jgi:hypothetical protein
VTREPPTQAQLVRISWKLQDAAQWLRVGPLSFDEMRFAEDPAIHVTRVDRARYAVACRWLPYCIRWHVSEPRVVALGREYKPVGQPQGRSVRYDYDQYAFSPPQIDREALLAALDGARGALEGWSSGWLYADGCTPWSSRRNLSQYWTRLDCVLLALGFVEDDASAK